MKLFEVADREELFWAKVFTPIAASLAIQVLNEADEMAMAEVGGKVPDRTWLMFATADKYNVGAAFSKVEILKVGSDTAVRVFIDLHDSHFDALKTLLSKNSKVPHHVEILDLMVESANPLGWHTSTSCRDATMLIQFRNLSRQLALQPDVQTELLNMLRRTGALSMYGPSGAPDYWFDFNTTPKEIHTEYCMSNTHTLYTECREQVEKLKLSGPDGHWNNDDDEDMGRHL